jgi:hypothetical protein
METKEWFKVQQCSAVKVVTKKVNHSIVLTPFIKFPFLNLLLFTVFCFALSMAPTAWTTKPSSIFLLGAGLIGLIELRKKFAKKMF